MSYLDEARSRAKRRKSPWNILLIPAVVLPLLTLWWPGCCLELWAL